MAEINSTKVCTGCKTAKPLTEFHRFISRSGYRPKCKACNRVIDKKYAQTAHGKRIKQKSKQKYRATANGIAVSAAYRHSPAYKKALALWYRTCPDKALARIAVSNAVQCGKLASAKTLKCVRCLNQAKQYHHWSYKPQHRLSVIPVCIKCHVWIHHG